MAQFLLIFNTSSTQLLIGIIPDNKGLAMPRMARINVPGALYHIMDRGIDGIDIFKDDNDRLQILSLFEHNLSKFGYQCFAWCLMSNHYHFLVQSSDVPLGKVMRPVNGAYARWYNKKYARHGYLFQNRFKSVLCQDQEYAKQLIRYIHLNPIRSGNVASLEELAQYKWCGHSTLLNENPIPLGAFLNKAQTLRRFGESPENAITNYLQYMAEGINPSTIKTSGEVTRVQKIEIIGSQKGWPAVIGDAKFAQNAMCNHEVEHWRHHRKADYLEVLESVTEKVCTRFNITKINLHKRGYRNNITMARIALCRASHFIEKIPYKIIADFLGITIPPAVKLSNRTEVAFATN